MQSVASFFDRLLEVGGVDIVGWLFALLVLIGATWFIRSILTWVLAERAARDKEMAAAVKEMAVELNRHSVTIQVHTDALQRALDRGLK